MTMFTTVFSCLPACVRRFRTPNSRKLEILMISGHPFGLYTFTYRWLTGFISEAVCRTAYMQPFPESRARRKWIRCTWNTVTPDFMSPKAAIMNPRFFLLPKNRFSSTSKSFVCNEQETFAHRHAGRLNHFKDTKFIKGYENWFSSNKFRYTSRHCILRSKRDQKLEDTYKTARWTTKIIQEDFCKIPQGKSRRRLKRLKRRNLPIRY